MRTRACEKRESGKQPLDGICAGNNCGKKSCLVFTDSLSDCTYM